MSIAEFSKVVRGEVYKLWFDGLGKNIINTSTNSFRAREQVASKTSFYITAETLQNMIKTIGNIDISDEDANSLLNELLAQNTKKGSPKADEIVVNGKRAVFYKNIGFDTITEKIKPLLYKYEEVDAKLSLAEQQFYDNAIAEIDNRYESLKRRGLFTQKSAKEWQEEKERAAKQAKLEGGLGNYFNKGHVISIATNLVKKFRDQVNKAEKIATDTRKDMIAVLDEYIAKLEADDLASANLPNAVTQSFYASYIKDPEYYLVEFQIKGTNIASGRASKPVLDELRDIFSLDTTLKTITNILQKSPQLGLTLLTTPGSDTGLDIIVQGVLSPLTGKLKPRRQNSPTIKIADANLPIKKNNNKKSIKTLKNMRNKLAAVKPISDSKQFIINDRPIDQLSIAPSLQQILTGRLVETIKQNMGSGNRKDILNLRSGRFAESVEVRSVSESKQGMITAFYSYMRNPYATFTMGGRQQYPRSRDPKLLISKSIRQLAQELAIKNLRAVAV